MYYLRKGTPNYMVCYILLLICQDMRLIAFVGDAILTCISVCFFGRLSYKNRHILQLYSYRIIVKFIALMLLEN